MNIKIDYKRGILFIRLEGFFNRLTYKSFNEQIFPIILKNELKYVVINFEKLKSIDKCGIDSLKDLFDITNKYDGRVSFCNIINLDMKDFINKNLVKDSFYETENELTSIGLFEL